MPGRTTTSEGLVRLGALLADETRAEILCSLMDGRAHTGSELARHIGVAASTMSEHLGKLLDSKIIVAEAQGRHRYWRLASSDIAELLETLGANATVPEKPKVAAALAYARTCYDHLAGTLAVDIYQSLLSSGHLSVDCYVLSVTSSGYEFLGQLGVDVEALRATKRAKARSCLDWTQRRHHLAGAAGKELLAVMQTRGLLKLGDKPRSVRVTQLGRVELPKLFDL